MGYQKLNCKFSKIKYVRPNYDEAKETIKQCVNGIKKAKSYEALKENFLKAQDVLLELDSMCSICSIRNSLDTNDKFYEEEDMINTEGMATLSLVTKKLNEALLASCYLEEFKNEFGELFIRTLQNEKDLIDKSIVSNIVKEDKLCQKYYKEIALCKTNFRGEECNFYGLLKHMESTDRIERKEAFIAWANLYESISDKLDNIYDRLIEVRLDKAKKLGFDNFTDYAYLSLNRFDYNKDDVKKFRDQVVKYVVPVANKLFMEQKETLGIEELYQYDEKLTFKDGNANPKGNKDELVAKASEMYNKLSKETGEYFDFMVKHELFDLETRPGKQQGGYCTTIPKYQAPFIFSNFNGTSADIEVLTHEAGHGFQAYSSSRNVKLASQVWSTYEACEIHSMSMEFITYPWMNKFFGKNVNKYRYAHLTGSLKTIPYLVAVDEFQHRVYEKPDMSAMDRRKVWKEIETKYMPWRKYDGNEFLENGGFWMQKQHIFAEPFYYIDYAIAQMCAFQFLIRSQNKKDKTWKEDYFNLCKLGGSIGFFALLDSANLKNPLKNGTIKPIMDEVEKIIGEYKNLL